MATYVWDMGTGLFCDIYTTYVFFGGDRRGRYRTVIGFITIYAISAYHH